MLGAAPFAASGCLRAIRDPRQLRALPASSLGFVVGLPAGRGRRIVVLRHCGRSHPVLLWSSSRSKEAATTHRRTRHARNIAAASAALPCECGQRVSLARTPWRRVAATGANLGGSSAATTRVGSLCCTGPGATLVKLETLAPLRRRATHCRWARPFSQSATDKFPEGGEGGNMGGVFPATRLIRDTGRLPQTRRSGFDSEENMTYPGHPVDPLLALSFHFPPGHHGHSCSRYWIFVDVR
ncbi:hypothetical protein MTO96_015549 [Rhipicephalus appendiculatus]